VLRRSGAVMLRGGSILTEGIRLEETDQPSCGGHQGDKKKVFGDGPEAVN
jgi:hypothetical protein